MPAAFNAISQAGRTAQAAAPVAAHESLAPPPKSIEQEPTATKVLPAKVRTRPAAWPWLNHLRRRGTLVALLALILFNLFFTPHFVSWQTLNVNLTQVCTIVIVAVGMTLVIGTAGIDLSVGSLMAISGALAPIIFLGKWGSSTTRWIS